MLITGYFDNAITRRHGRQLLKDVKASEKLWKHHVLDAKSPKDVLSLQLPGIQLRVLDAANPNDCKDLEMMDSQRVEALTIDNEKAPGNVLLLRADSRNLIENAAHELFHAIQATFKSLKNAPVFDVENAVSKIWLFSTLTPEQKLANTTSIFARQPIEKLQALRIQCLRERQTYRLVNQNGNRLNVTKEALDSGRYMLKHYQKLSNLCRTELHRRLNLKANPNLLNRPPEKQPLPAWVNPIPEGIGLP